MKANSVKILLIAGALLLSACSGISTSSSSSYSSSADQQYGAANNTKTSFSGGLGSSFNQYSLGLMEHD